MALQLLSKTSILSVSLTNLIMSKLQEFKMISMDSSAGFQMQAEN